MGHGPHVSGHKALISSARKVRGPADSPPSLRRQGRQQPRLGEPGRPWLPWDPPHQAKDRHSHGTYPVLSPQQEPPGTDRPGALHFPTDTLAAHKARTLRRWPFSTGHLILSKIKAHPSRPVATSGKGLRALQSALELRAWPQKLKAEFSSTLIGTTKTHQCREHWASQRPQRFEPKGWWGRGGVQADRHAHWELNQ